MIFGYFIVYLGKAWRYSSRCAVAIYANLFFQMIILYNIYTYILYVYTRLCIHARIACIHEEEEKEKAYYTLQSEVRTSFYAYVLYRRTRAAERKLFTFRRGRTTGIYILYLYTHNERLKQRGEWDSLRFVADTCAAEYKNIRADLARDDRNCRLVVFPCAEPVLGARSNHF